MAKPDSAPRFEAYLTVREAAKTLGVSAWTLRYRDRTGKLIPNRHPLSGYGLYLRQDLDSLLSQVAASRGGGKKPAGSRR